MKFNGFHCNTLCNFKEWGIRTKNSYLNSISSYITKHGTKLIPGHSSLIR